MKETMIEIVHERAAGMGISKRDVKVCIRVQGAGCRVQGAGCRVQGAGTSCGTPAAGCQWERLCY